MKTFKKGQIIISNHTRNDHLLNFSKGMKMIVNDVVELNCKCANDSHWCYVWTGISGPRQIEYSCSTCKNVNFSDKRHFFASWQFDAVEYDETRIAKLQAQTELLKLLASRKIDQGVYEKIMSLVDNGDDELLQLGRQLLEKLEKDGMPN